MTQVIKCTFSDLALGQAFVAPSLPAIMRKVSASEALEVGDTVARALDSDFPVSVVFEPSHLADAESFN